MEERDRREIESIVVSFVVVVSDLLIASFHCSRKILDSQEFANWKLCRFSFFCVWRKRKMGSCKERLIVDVESGSAVLLGSNSSATADSGEYVRLAESADQTTATAFSRDGSRRSLRIASTVLVTLCCLIVALHGTVSLYERIDVLVRRGGVAPPALLSCNELEAVVHKRLDDSSLQHPHRTSFHYQPAKNWMNGKQKMASDRSPARISLDFCFWICGRESGNAIDSLLIDGCEMKFLCGFNTDA